MFCRISTRVALFVAALVLLESTAWAQDACVWGFDPDETVLNGEYVEEASTYNGFSYYSKMVPTTDGMACGYSMLYVVFHNGRWKIISDLGNPVAALATCNAAVFIDSPFDCGANWEVTATASLDADATVLEDECPVIACDSISVFYSTPGLGPDCTGAYEVSSLGPNLFERDVGGGDYTYVYFNPLRFKWQCGDSIDDDCSVVNYDEDAGTGFPAFTAGGLTGFTGVTADGDFFVECLVDPASASSGAACGLGFESSFVVLGLLWRRRRSAPASPERSD